MWVAQIPADGTYDIVTDGDVNGYISPQLAFGHGSEYGWLPWLFAGLFALIPYLTATVDRWGATTDGVLIE